MKCKDIEEFKEKLQKAIKCQDIEQFKLLTQRGAGCCFQSFRGYSGETGALCPGCPLAEEGGPKELIGVSVTCLVGSIRDICYSYYVAREINEETALVNLALMSIKLLAYLDTRR